MNKMLNRKGIWLPMAQFIIIVRIPASVSIKCSLLGFLLLVWKEMKRGTELKCSFGNTARNCRTTAG